MKTEAIRLCIQAQHGKEDYAEACKEFNALLARLEELEAAQHRAHPTGGGLCAVCGKSADHHEDHDYVAPLTATSG